MTLSKEKKLKIRQLNPDIQEDPKRPALDLTIARVLHEAGKFSTIGAAVDWIVSRREKYNSIPEIKDLEERKKATEDLAKSWRKMIPPGSAIDKERARQYLKIGSDTEEMERLRKELAKIREERDQAKKELEKRDKKLERIRKRRPPEKTAWPVQYLNLDFTTDKTIQRIVDSPELRGDPIRQVRKERITGMIDRGLIRLDLSVAELRVVQGIFNLTTDTLTKDGYAQGPIKLKSWADFYRACRVREYKTKQGWMELDKKDKMDIYRAFFKLRIRQFNIIIRAFKCYDKKSKEKLYTVMAEISPLFEARFFRDNVREGKLEEVTKQLKNPTFVTPIDEIWIYPNKILLTNYSETFCRLVDSTLYHDIKGALSPGERVSKYDFRFILWLVRHKLNLGTIVTNMESLADELGMVEYLKPRKRLQKIEKILLRAYDIAYKLGYLLKPAQHRAEAKRGSKEVFVLNPEKVVHARQKKLPLLLG